MTAEAITVHNTANDASAENEITYMNRNTKLVSFHFAVDDREVRQGLPLDINRIKPIIRRCSTIPASWEEAVMYVELRKQH